MGLGRGGQVGRSSDEARHLVGDLIEQLAARRTGRHRTPDLETGIVQRHRPGIEMSRPSGREIRIRLDQSRGPLAPRAARMSAPVHRIREELVDLTGNVERLVGRPAHRLLGRPDLLFSQR